jgi:hypothetical protein
MSVEKFNSKTTITHEVVPFVQVNRNVIQKIKDIQAGFIWVYLLSMPANWNVVKSQIKNHFGLGDDKLKKIFSTLNAHNLIRYDAVKDNVTHKIIRWDIHVLNGSEFVELIDKKVKKPTGVNSTRVENHTSGKPATTKKIQYKDDKKTKRASGSPSLQSFPNYFFPNDESRKLLSEHAARTNNTENDLFEKFETVSKKYKTKSNDWQKTFREFLEKELPRKVYEDEKGRRKTYMGTYL